MSSRLVTDKFSGTDVQHNEVQPHVVEEFLEIAMSLYDRADDGRTSLHDECQSHRLMDPDHLQWEAGPKIALRAVHDADESGYIMRHFGPAAIPHIIDTRKIVLEPNSGCDWSDRCQNTF